MAISLTVNGQTYAYPQPNDSNWGLQATAWAQAVTNGMLQKAGGQFTLTADVDFGSSFGLISKYFASRTANSADSGQVRLANADSVSWRNSGDSADYALKPSTDGFLQYNSIQLVNLSSAQSLTNKTLSGPSLTTPSIILSGSVSGAITMGAGTVTPYSLTWPSAQGGASTVLTNNGSGVLSWASALTSSLPSAQIFVGNGSGVSTAVAVTGDITLSNAGVTAIASGVIVNADVNASAAIAYSKLNLATSIVNADISASAAIAFSKLASLTSANILVGNGSNVATAVAMSGDVAISNTGATTIQNLAVTAAKIANATITTTQISASAGITGTQLASATVAQSNMAARTTGTTVSNGGVGVSASTGSFSSTSASFVDVTNLSITITTTGNPVQMMLIPGGGGSASEVGNTGGGVYVQFVRGSTSLGFASSSSTGSHAPSCFANMDPVAAGTYTYKVQAAKNGGTSFFFSDVKLLVWEMK